MVERNVANAGGSRHMRQFKNPHKGLFLFKSLAFFNGREKM